MKCFIQDANTKKFLAIGFWDVYDMWVKDPNHPDSYREWVDDIEDAHEFEHEGQIQIELEWYDNTSYGTCDPQRYFI